jgi:hypothetical protein
VVDADGLTWLEVGPSMVNILDEADRLPLVSGKFGMVRSDGSVEEGDWVMALVKDRPHARA